MSRRVAGKGFIFTIFMITLLVLAHLWQKVYITQLSQKIQSLEQIKKKIEGENKQLLVRWAQLSDPQRMEGIAKGWGFSYPSPQDVVFLIVSPSKREQGKKRGK